MACLAGGWFLLPSPERSLVVYCSQDARHARAVMDAFTEATGIEVVPRFDTEATKSLGLVEQIRMEGMDSRADVFWNNQLLSTLDVEHLMTPHGLGPGTAAPQLAQDPDRRWIAFGGRVRGWIRHQPTFDQLGGDAHSIASQHPSRIASARPQFGSTRTHLAAELESDADAGWLSGSRALGRTVVAGNAQVADVVASGACAVGLTDSDDYFAVRDRDTSAAGDVTFEPFRLSSGKSSTSGVLVIPNSVGILVGTKRRKDAEAFVRFLTGPQGQRILAEGSGRQLPSHPELWRDPQQLPRDVVWLAGLVAPPGAPPGAWLRSLYPWQDPKAAAVRAREFLQAQ